MLGRQTFTVLLEIVMFLDHAPLGAKLHKSKHAVQELKEFMGKEEIIFIGRV